MVRLLANPGDWHGKRVLTSGYLYYGAFGPALFLTPGDAVHGVTGNRIILDFTPEQLSDAALRAEVDEAYVAVTGLFEELDTGDLILKEVDEVLVYADKSSERDH